jgi:hypothetical protein
MDKLTNSSYSEGFETLLIHGLSKLIFICICSNIQFELLFIRNQKYCLLNNLNKNPLMIFSKIFPTVSKFDNKKFLILIIVVIIIIRRFTIEYYYYSVMI